MAIATVDGYSTRLINTALDNIPAEDVKYVVHAYWVVKGHDVFCSACEKKNGYDAWDDNAFPDYCPKCGANMDADMSKKERE